MFRSILMVFICFTAAACTPVERYSVTINPSFFTQHTSVNARSTGPSNLLLDNEGSGRSPELTQWRAASAAENAVLVGFSNDILRRPDPLPNNRWTWRVWQAKAFFDMGLLPDGAILQQATLVFAAPLVSTNIRTYPQREGATNGCSLRIGSAIDPVSVGASSAVGPASTLPYRPTRPGFDVRGAGRMMVQFSPALWTDLKVVRKFLFTQMYRAPSVVKMRAEVTQVVEDLFPLFMAAPSHLPKQWRKDVAEADSETALARIVSDYISGMTDRFALETHARLVG